MDDLKRTEEHSDYTAWWSRLVARLSLHLRPIAAREYANGMVETFISEEPFPTEFCEHTRLARFLARIRSRMLKKRRSESRATGCPLCRKLPIRMATVEWILTVWFKEGEIYEFAFKTGRPGKCYVVRDSALHIFMKESTASYPLDAILAVNFGKRTLPPASPEVVEAERILSGYHID